ncbi:MAG: M42 family metallopeptidase [Gemmatimonadota bacterium]|jgi:endoglucanase|nr:M42 family metallopeptidase [Gemmatimonadota bacterium]
MITDDSFSFLAQLLDAPGPSSFEIAPARIWRTEAGRFADQVDADVSGNSIAIVNPGGSPRIMLAGHIDEIGLIITHICDEGFLYFDGIGGWDPQVLVGQRVRILTQDGEVIGVIGKKPIHLITAEEREKASKLKDLWMDIGAKNPEETAERGVRIGDPAVIDSKLVRLNDELVVSRAMDNRIGAYIVLETLRRLANNRTGLKAEVAAVATTQEEIGPTGGGVRTAAHRFDPAVAIVVDVTFATDAPEIDEKRVGEHDLGSGPVLSRGSAAHPIVFERLAAAAEAEQIPYTIQASGRQTMTDADAIYLSRDGVATALVSVPNRYMHSPNEMVSLQDLDASIRLIEAFIRGVDENTDFTPR